MSDPAKPKLGMPSKRSTPALASRFQERVFEFAGPLPDDRASDGRHLGVEITFGGGELRCPAMIETRIH
jgi:hypothetical protein